MSGTGGGPRYPERPFLTIHSYQALFAASIRPEAAPLPLFGFFCPTTTTNYCRERRYTNIPLGTKDRSGQTDSSGLESLRKTEPMGGRQDLDPRFLFEVGISSLYDRVTAVCGGCCESALEFGAIPAVLVLVTNLWEWPRWNLLQAAQRRAKRVYDASRF
jgi:hypothetical protein